MKMHLHNTGRRRTEAPFSVFLCIYLCTVSGQNRRQKTAQVAGKCNPSQAEQTSGKRWKRTLQCIGYGKWQQLATVQRADGAGAMISGRSILRLQVDAHMQGGGVVRLFSSSAKTLH